ncbi:hypothetical protein DevBK_06265 [Devosia sp. BK]|uniref:GFA family protein n=1 Tax=Devosia sp. BK TaxID=2871706 RepID=UPI00293B09D0|nr:hypothetical protein [Devosia sp. BK]MDV3250932.1 hypothetical protein [Devosia sp. BK]
MAKSVVTCSCEQVALELDGAPFISTECHCNSCREAAGRLQPLPLARPMLEDNGGTQFVLYRKDKVAFLRGQDLLEVFRLGPDAPTRRVISRCCNSPIFLEFQSGHWLSLYSSLWPAETRPKPELRTMTSDKTDGIALADDVPAGTAQTLRFYRKLLGAWIAMGFKTPKIRIGNDT